MSDLRPITTHAPSSQVWVCKSVPFGRDYTSTILFKSYEEQRNFLSTRAKYKENAMKPFTLGQPIRINHPAEQMYECNYIYFTSQTSARHWCAFITNIVRVNDNVADLYYELDVLQNWQLEWNLGTCMVLREHVTDDTPGANLQPEPIDTGDYVVGRHMRTGLFADMGVLLMQVSNETLDTKCLGGIFQSSTPKFFEVNHGIVDGALVDLLKSSYENPDSILSLSMFPKRFFNNTGVADTTPALVDMQSVHYTDIDGYKARNFKLYTYPYNMLYCTDMDGNACVWRYEWFPYSGGMRKLNAGCACAVSPIAQAVIAPFQYAGYESYNWDAKVSMQPFPMCSWVTDTYRAYLAQNGVSIFSALAGSTVSIVGGVAGIAGGAYTANPAGIGMGMQSVASGAMTAGNTLQDIRNHAVQPAQAKGSTAGDTMFSLGYTAKDFHIWQKCIQREYAEKIDDFFDVFGYAVNEVKKVKIDTRPSWNYIQTQNIQITGEIALADIEKLNAIFDRGVTFWHGDFVGDYGRANK